MMRYLAELCFFLLFLFFSDGIQAQDTAYFDQHTKLLLIETRDGSTFWGNWISENEKEVVIDSRSIGIVTVVRTNIKNMREIKESELVRGKYWFENPNPTRYIVTATAIPLRKGEGYYQNHYLFIQSVNVGLSDHFSLGLSTEIISPIFGKSPPQVFMLSPKLGYQVAPKVYLGAGVLYFFGSNRLFRNDIAKARAGLAYGLATLGNGSNNFTFGMGWAAASTGRLLAGSNNSASTYISKRPVLTLSTMIRVGRRLALVSENWLYPSSSVSSTTGSIGIIQESKRYYYGGTYSYGIRFMAEKLSIDFGFFNSKSIANDIAIGIPYIDFAVKFGLGKLRRGSKYN